MSLLRNPCKNHKCASIARRKRRSQKRRGVGAWGRLFGNSNEEALWLPSSFLCLTSFPALCYFMGLERATQFFLIFRHFVSRNRSYFVVVFTISKTKNANTCIVCTSLHQPPQNVQFLAIHSQLTHISYKLTWTL